MALKIITIDDEKYIRDFIIEYVGQNFHEELVIVGEAASVKNGLKLIKESKPDIVLLDIELEDGMSFDILEILDSVDFEIIFITGFDDKAINAIKFGALDYILKPIDEDELGAGLKRAILSRKKLTTGLTSQMTDVANAYYKSDIREHVVLKTFDTIHIVKLETIMYCKSEGNYTTFFVNDKSSILISKPLKYSMELLPKDNFVRCQQSYIVNVQYIASLLKSGSIILNDNTELPISGGRKEEIIKEIFDKMK
jgi:two-component system LytT family response regulator